MTEKTKFENIFNLETAIPNKNGVVICPYCNGTGENDEYELFNKFQNLNNFPVKAYCRQCYGVKQGDWIEIATGRIKEKMEFQYKFYNAATISAFVNFFKFVYYNYRWQNREGKRFQYDVKADIWNEVKGSDILENDFYSNHLDAKKSMTDWIEKFLKDGYINDPESIYVMLDLVYEKKGELV